MNKEIWKDIKNYEGLYMVSNKGNVYSFSSKRNMKIQKRKDNYEYIDLFKNNKRERFSIHRLVAETFLDNKNQYKEINHIDEDPSNNNIENLEWCSHKYNMNYGTRTKRAVQTRKNKDNYKKGQPIICYNNNGFIKEYNSVKDAEIELNNGKRSHIRECCIGIRIRSLGFYWKYKKGE